MEEKINHLIKERAPWLAKKNFISLFIFNFLKKLLRFDETIYAGDYIQNLSGAEAFNWLGAVSYTHLTLPTIYSV